MGRILRNLLWIFCVAALAAMPPGSSVCSAGEDSDSLKIAELVNGIRPLVSSLAGREDQFSIEGQITLPIDGKPQQIDVKSVRYDSESFDFAVTHSDYALEIRRRSGITALALPKHSVVFLGKGDVAPEDSLSADQLLSRLVSPASKISTWTQLTGIFTAGDLDTTLKTILATQKLSWESDANRWTVDGNVHFCIQNEGQFVVETGDVRVALQTVVSAESPSSATEWTGMTVKEISREELERTLVRGVRRATEILEPGDQLTNPSQKPRSVPNGQLLWIDGQRVALLKGTPEQIGEAHGKLLPDESTRCIESVLYTFGTAHVVRTGHWFRDDLKDAFARLNPHIPERHKVEMRALASALELDPQTVEVLNVFPELFHCSGFAVFGSATMDGKLYHGRVLDYMTTIGLQDAATTFIVQAEGQIPFANVGYAGFVGSVSGMNAEAISLGEMGGRGEGKWDGAPMATLMRRALEECRTLDEVKALWANSPRTCEYYYVFADGKANQAVGVAATPEMIEFVNPGQSHERLGEGISDTVVLSAGSRLEELRRRVTEKHGQIDADLGMWLMSRPVAMQSNLHNVLFVPQDGVLYVANASHLKPAAEMPYVRLDLQALLKQM
ncbi:MAG: peptidase C45 acyl-coenzyme A:6-aminopenicillanic acid acyl-transferase [Planctomyces sp.]|nr:peptidase C45 acyl-coenzyme A:6-aminopenicillanic acid acyl-transferase [Planctomyces sp.]